MCKECEAKEKKGEKRGVLAEPERSLGERGPCLGGAASVRLGYSHRTQGLGSRKVAEAQVIKRTCPRVNSSHSP